MDKSLKVKLGLNTDDFLKGLTDARGAAERFHQDRLAKERQYTAEFERLLRERDAAQAASDQRAASRSIQARQLLRQRAADRSLRAEDAYRQSFVGRGMGALTGLAGQIGLGFAAFKGASMAREAIAFADDISDTSEALGVAPGFLQQFGGLSGMAGVKNPNKALASFSKAIAEGGLGKMGISTEGKTIQELFYQVSNALSNMSDPAQRAAMALHLFGKEGYKLTGLMAQGAEALSKSMASIPTLSDADIAHVGKLDDTIMLLKRHLQVTAGMALGLIAPSSNAGTSSIMGNMTGTATLKMLSAMRGSGMLSALLSGMGAATGSTALSGLSKYFSPSGSAGMSPVTNAQAVAEAQQKLDSFLLSQLKGEDKLSALKSQQAKLQKEMKDSGNDAANLLRIELEMRKNSADISETQAEIDKRRLETEKERLSVTRQIRHAEDAAAASQAASYDFGRWTLADLARLDYSSPWSRGRGSRRVFNRDIAARNENIREARNIEDLQNQQRDLWAMGRFSQAAGMTEVISDLRKQLGPLTSVEQSAYEQKQEAVVTALYEAMAANGAIPVKPIMGK